MELITKIDAVMRVSAGLEEDGTLNLKVFAQADYAPGRSTTASIEAKEIPDALKAKVTQALLEVQQASVTTLGKRIQRALAKSYEVAAQMGEL